MYRYQRTFVTIFLLGLHKAFGFQQTSIWKEEENSDETKHRDFFHVKSSKVQYNREGGVQHKHSKGSIRSKSSKQIYNREAGMQYQYRIAKKRPKCNTSRGGRCCITNQCNSGLYCRNNSANNCYCKGHVGWNTGWCEYKRSDGELSDSNRPNSCKSGQLTCGNCGSHAEPERDCCVCGKVNTISMTKTSFQEYETVSVEFTIKKHVPKDWIGIYRTGQTPGPVPSTQWAYTNKSAGTLDFKNLDKGTYFAALFENDGYKILAQTSFDVGVGY